MARGERERENESQQDGSPRAGMNKDRDQENG